MMRPTPNSIIDERIETALGVDHTRRRAIRGKDRLVIESAKLLQAVSMAFGSDETFRRRMDAHKLALARQLMQLDPMTHPAEFVAARAHAEAFDDLAALINQSLSPARSEPK